MNEIGALLLKTISEGLRRKTAVQASRWAEYYRTMGPPVPGPFGYKYHPWLYEMHDAWESHDTIVGQKAAQMGYTEWAINMAFYSMDIRGLDVLYVLPTALDASNFSSGRFDPALENSKYLRDFFKDVNNVGMKRAGTNTLYVRGSHSRSQLKSIPTGVVIFDELDEMPRNTVALAQERQSGQFQTLTLFVSTPTIEDFGINFQFKLSTQEYYHFKCPSCRKHITLNDPNSLVVTGESLNDPRLNDSYYQCIYCYCHLLHESKPDLLKPRDLGGTGIFVPAYSDRDIRGFHVTQFYSSAKIGRPHEMAKAYLMSKMDPSYAQEYHNSKLGSPYEEEGARVNEKQIVACTGEYVKGDVNSSRIRTMGIDVGAVLHIVIKEWDITSGGHPGISMNDLYQPRVVYEGRTSGSARDFEEAYKLFNDYGCSGCVVDAEPERRAALQFAQTLFGRVYLCDYLFSQHGREVQVNEQELTIKANRTAWMDVALSRYKNVTVKLPANLSDEFKAHVKSPVRVYKEDKFGNKYAVYVNTKPDHFAHADTYAELALPLSLSIAHNVDITEMY